MTVEKCLRLCVGTSALLGFLAHETCSATKVACIGTSITQGNRSEYAAYGIPIDAGGYPTILQSKLGSSYAVSNLGLGGRIISCPTAPGGVSYWNNGAYHTAMGLRADVCVVEFGTNDSRLDTWPTCGSSFAYHYGRLIDSLQAAKSAALIFPCRPLPMFLAKHIYQDSVLVNSIIPVIDSIARYKRLRVVDLRTPFLTRSALLRDGCHPDSTGMRIIAELVYDAILGTAIDASERLGGVKSPQGRRGSGLVLNRGSVVLTRSENQVFSIRGSRLRGTGCALGRH